MRVSMDRVRFSPFSRPLARLRANDLAVLRDVPEGWWVEYKLQPNGKRGIAKSISSFANSEGGWIFYGIEEVDSDGEKRAGCFQGVPLSSIPSIRNDIRTAANHHTKPTPFYDVKVLKGPCDEIGLAEERGIVVVLVPLGHDAPYIHSKGVVYRRKADESDPVPETDRSRMDSLWERGRRDRSRLATVIDTDPVLAQSESNMSYARLFLLADPFGERGYRSEIGLEQFRKAVGKSIDPEHVDMVFDTTYQEGDCYVGRMVAGNSPYQAVLTLEYLPDCSFIATIPLNTWPVLRNHGDLRAGLRRYKFASEFLDLVDTDADERDARVVDLNYLAVVIMGLFAKHRVLLEMEGAKIPVMAKLRLGNMWRRIPFVDMPEYMQCIKEDGLPVVGRQVLLVPPGTEPGSMLRVETKDWRKRPGTNLLPKSIDLALDALEAVGVHAGANRGSEFAIHLVEAACRSVGPPPSGLSETVT